MVKKAKSDTSTANLDFEANLWLEDKAHAGLHFEAKETRDARA